MLYNENSTEENPMNASTLVVRARLKLASRPFQQRSMCVALKRLKVE